MKLAGNWFSLTKKPAVIVATVILFVSSLISLAPSVLATQPGGRALEPTDMQHLIFVWASGTTSIQQKASGICQADHFSPGICAGISAEVRGAWLNLMQVDPASLGRLGVRENLAGRTQVYNALEGKLSSLTQGKQSLLLAQTQQTLQQLNASLQQASATSYTVWATSFIQKSLPMVSNQKPVHMLRYRMPISSSRTGAIFRVYHPSTSRITRQTEQK